MLGGAIFHLRMANQSEKSMEHELETGFKYGPILAHHGRKGTCASTSFLLLVSSEYRNDFVHGLVEGARKEPPEHVSLHVLMTSTTKCSAPKP